MADVTLRPGSACKMAPDATSPARILLQPELYRIRDAAIVLGVSERMVYQFIEGGHLAVVRLPGTGTKRSAVRVARADLLAFVESRRDASRMVTA